MSGKKQVLGLCLALLFIGASVSGCAFSKFGKASVSYFDIEVPAWLTGKAKTDVLKSLGVPDSIVKAGGSEYWVYKNKCGFFILIIGQTYEKDLIVVFKGDKVGSSYLVENGSSVGVFTFQGAVGS